MPEQPSPAVPPLDTRRTSNFSSVYANNIRFEASVWDLKLIFGELDQREPGNLIVEQHTSVTIPWAQVKLMIYFLQVNLAFQEAAYGKMKIPLSVLPPELGPIPKELENDPQARASYEFVSKLRNELIANSL